MKYIFSMVLLFSLPHAWSEQPKTVGTSLNEVRRELGASLDSVINGSCQQQIVEQQGFESGSPGYNSKLRELSTISKTIDFREKENKFIQKVRGEQLDVISCEISQLRYLYQFGDGFLQDVMSDLCEKLPELRIRRKRVDSLKRRITFINARLLVHEQTKLVSTPATFGDSARKVVSQSALLLMGPFMNVAFRQAARLSENEVQDFQRELKLLNKDLSLNAQVYNTLKGSLWRFSDPVMDQYIEEQIGSGAHPSSCIGAISSRGNKKFSGEDVKRAYSVREEFREKTLLSMISDLQSNITSLNMLSPAGLDLLLERSDYADALAESGKQGKVADQLLMCHLIAQTRGDKYTRTTLEAATFVTGGVGLFLKLARVATIMRPANVQRALSASKVLLMSSALTSLPLTAVTVQDSCFGGVATSTYKMGQSVCPRDGRIIDIQRHQIDKENCALSLVLATLEVAPGVAEYLGAFKGGGKVLGNSDVIVAAAKADSADSLRLKELLDAPEVDEIVVTAKRSPRSSSLPSKNSSLIEQSSKDADLLNDRLRQSLREFSTDLERDRIDILSGRLAQVLARYPDLSAKDIELLKKTEGAISKIKQDLAKVPEAEVPKSIRGRERSFQSFSDLVLEYPELSKTLAKIGENIPVAPQITRARDIPFDLSGSFRPIDADKMRERADALDPRIHDQIVSAYNALNNPTVIENYFKKLFMESAEWLARKGTPEDVELLKQGFVNRHAISIVLIRRFKSRGENTFTTLVESNGKNLSTGRIDLGDVDLTNGNISFRAAIRTGPFVDKGFDEVSREGHGVFSHMMQRDLVDPAIRKSTNGNPAEFYQYLGTPKGVNFWADLFDSGNTSSLTRPETAVEYMSHKLTLPVPDP